MHAQEVAKAMKKIGSISRMLRNNVLSDEAYWATPSAEHGLVFNIFQITPTFACGREGIDNPFITLVARFLFVCAGTRRLACNLLLD